MGCHTFTCSLWPPPSSPNMITGTDRAMRYCSPVVLSNIIHTAIVECPTAMPNHCLLAPVSSSISIIPITAMPPCRYCIMPPCDVRFCVLGADSLRQITRAGALSAFDSKINGERAPYHPCRHACPRHPPWRPQNIASTRAGAQAPPPLHRDASPTRWCRSPTFLNSPRPSMQRVRGLGGSCLTALHAWWMAAVYPSMTGVGQFHE
eukprot:1141301-Pelagomonas_calceolata.AAC.4